MKRIVFVSVVMFGFALVAGGLSTATMLWGLLLAGFLLLLRGIVPTLRYPLWTLWKLSRFFLHFIVDLLKSNLVLAWDVLSPHDYHMVRMVLVPVGDLNTREIAFLIIRVMLTPGTVPCGMDVERKVLLIHAMFADENSAWELRRPIDILKGNA